MVINTESFLGWARSKKISKRNSAAAACNKLFNMTYNMTEPEKINEIKKACGDPVPEPETPTTQNSTIQLVRLSGNEDQPVSNASHAPVRAAF